MSGRAHVSRRAVAHSEHPHAAVARDVASPGGAIGDLGPAACVAMRAKKAPVEFDLTRPLELFDEALAESERARAEPVVANDRRRRWNADVEAVLEPAKPSTPPGGIHAAAVRAAPAKPSTGGQRTLLRLSVSPGEAAEMLGVSRDYFDEHILHELRIVRRGRRILIAIAELERWLDRAATL